MGVDNNAIKAALRKQKEQAQAMESQSIPTQFQHSRNSNTAMPTISSSSTVFKEMGVILTGTHIDEIFIDDAHPNGGIPYCDFLVFGGLPNTGKSYLAALIAAVGAKQDGKKAMWIATEPSGYRKAPDYLRNKELFDTALAPDLDSMALLIGSGLDDKVGSKYSVVIIDSVSEVTEDSEYMPEDASKMLAPLKERARQIRIIKETIRKWIVEGYTGKRGKCVVIMICHMKRITRPDNARVEEVILPIFGKTGSLVSGYTFTGALSDMLYYLASYVFIFTDATSANLKGEDVGDKTPTIIKVYPHKSRSCSRFNTKTFRITNGGIVR